MEGKEKPRPGPDYLMQLMNDKKLMSSLPNFCGIFQHLERLLDQGETRYRAVIRLLQHVRVPHSQNTASFLLL